MSSFGKIFRVTTFGESHCRGVGAIIDGCPPMLHLSEADIQPQLTRRRPGQSSLTTPRSESDRVQIQSGTEGGFTLGTPIGLFVPNLNVKPQDYSEMTKIPRPGHADFLYQAKYGIRAASGGGRSSARETIGRVAAGAVAEKWLRQQFGTEIVSFVSSVGYILLAPEAHRNSEGKPWTRAEVDIRGTLRLIAGENYSQALKEGADEAALKQAREQDEAAFVAAGPPPAREGERPPPGTFAQSASSSSSSSSSAEVATGASTGSSASTGAAGAPCYVDSEGNLYDREGSLVGKCKEAAPTVDSLGTVSPPTGKQTEAARNVLPGLTDDVVQVRCPCPSTSARMATLIRWIKSQKDSTGGTLACTCSGVPIGLGEPCFDKLEAQLAHAMLSLPATKGFEIGSGFDGTRLRGSLHNDMFAPAGDAPTSWTGQAEKAVLAATSATSSAVAVASSSSGAASSSSSSLPGAAGPVQVHGTMTQGKVLLRPATNRAGGTLGGISTGADIEFRVAIKPVSTIGREQKTAGFDGGVTELKARGRHDPCVLPRAPPLVEGMAALVLADAALVQATRRPPVTFAQAVATSGKVATGSDGEATAAVGEKRSMPVGATASGSGAAAEAPNGTDVPAAAKKARTEPA